MSAISVLIASASIIANTLSLAMLQKEFKRTFMQVSNYYTEFPFNVYNIG